MSLVVTVNVREGLVMAADSRITLNAQQPQQGGQQTVHLAVGMSDSNRKLFVTPNNVGIGTYGQADIQGVPIAGFIDSFIASLPPNLGPQQTAQNILAHFHAMNAALNTCFHVAGYDASTPPSQEVWTVEVQPNRVQKVNQPNQQGLAFGGEGDTVARLLQPVAVAGPNNTWQPLPPVSVPINFFTIQDAIDFGVHLIRTTIDSIRFQSRPKTVGGPIDVLVIRPGTHEWVSLKKLQMP